MKYTRLDHSDDIIHFTRNAEKWSYQESYDLFYKIIQDGYLESTKTNRLGDIPTICFTESPYACLTDNCELNKKYFKRYSPFGFQFSKKYIYELGGLPAIYSPKNDFEKDNDKTNWRTVSYNPTQKNYKDFTWEREWRIKPENNRLELNGNNVKLVFPSLKWAQKFRNDHDEYHKDSDCECNCSRNCTIIDFDRFYSKEEHKQLLGSCANDDEFPWILLNMNCKNIPEPK